MTRLSVTAFTRLKGLAAHDGLRGELQASAELRQAADVLSPNPASLQLRYLQTLLELGADQNSTVVFPLPLDIVGPWLNNLTRGGGAGAVENAADNGTGPARVVP